MMKRHTTKGCEGNRRAFTLIELLVVVAIIGILAAILFPVFARARENARRASCQSNVKQILLGIMQYTQDHDERYMPMYTTSPSEYWPQMVAPYLKSTQIYNCPSATGAPYSAITNLFPYYGINTQLFECNGVSTCSPKGIPLSFVEKPSETVLMTDSEDLVNKKGNPRVNPQGFSTISAYNAPSCYPQYRHLDTTTVGFFDGHVKAMRKTDLEKVVSSEDGYTFASNDDGRFVLWNQY
jgi:prepilin-type N-terminal cleavage/methylation domain-containing protein/prepilin-type processing-associated H-X9-DG protein